MEFPIGYVKKQYSIVIKVRLLNTNTEEYLNFYLLYKNGFNFLKLYLKLYFFIGI